jgi:predicted Zn-dependent protease
LTYILLGQYDQAVAEAREAIRLNPNFAPSRRALGWALHRLNRFAEAKDALAQAMQQKMDTTDFHAILYQIAFTGGDAAGMKEQIEWTRGKPQEYVAFDWQTGGAAFAGQWRKAQNFSQHAIDLAARGETIEVAAQYATEQALRGAVFGDCRRGRADAAQGLKLERGRVSLPRAALALALCGEANQAKSLVGELAKRYPEDAVINSIWLPAIRAALELQRGNAAQAIDQLQAASRYEAAAEFWPQHLRGQAYLKLGRGAESAAEFQKILDHRGYAPLSPLYPLAHLGLARAAALTGDRAKSQKGYEDFFAAWKEADADLPALLAARKEYR